MNDLSYPRASLRSYALQRLCLASVGLGVFLMSAIMAHGQSPDTSGPSEGLPDAPSALLQDAPPQMQAEKKDTRRPKQEDRTGPSNLFEIPAEIVQDQVAFFKSPAALRKRDLKWILPLGGAMAAALATDSHTMGDVVSRDSSITNMSARVSDVIRYGFLGGPTLMVFLGRAGKNEHFHRAGLLGIEAFGDAYLVSTLFKFTSYRERPFLDNGRGHFFSADAGANSSFPSGHSMTAFAAATVLAEEYPTLWKQTALYSLATGVSITRVLGQRHFPSDVLIGSAGGWLIGHYVYRSHHRHNKLPDLHAVSIERKSFDKSLGSGE